jgi:hypothetical protein
MGQKVVNNLGGGTKSSHEQIDRGNDFLAWASTTLVHNSEIFYLATIFYMKQLLAKFPYVTRGGHLPLLI